MAEDTLSLRLDEAESRFYEKNLFLLAASYNVSMADAQVMQAKIYPNPVLYAEAVAIDRENGKYPHAGSTGQKVIGIEQVILLGGKRKKEVDLARNNREISEKELTDLLRNLQYELWRSFFSLYHHYRVIENYDRQLVILDTLIANYEVQVQKNNIPLKELIRLKTIYFKLNNLRSEQRNILNEENQNLCLLLQHRGIVIPIPDPERFQSLVDAHSLELLQEKSSDGRPDLRVAMLALRRSELNLRFQKSLAIPDLNLTTTYDQRGGAFDNQVSLGVGMPLPVFNRNQGNIKLARYGIKHSEIYLEQTKLMVENEVITAWKNHNRSISEYQRINSMFNDEFELVFEGVNTNFQRKNISLIEFTDFVEAYNEALAEVERIRQQLAITAARVNHAVGVKIY